jgi:hypothetical protein
MHDPIRKFGIKKTLKLPNKAMHYDNFDCTAAMIRLRFQLR